MSVQKCASVRACASARVLSSCGARKSECPNSTFPPYRLSALAGPLARPIAVSVTGCGGDRSPASFALPTLVTHQSSLTDQSTSTPLQRCCFRWRRETQRGLTRVGRRYFHSLSPSTELGVRRSVWRSSPTSAGRARPRQSVCSGHNVQGASQNGRKRYRDRLLAPTPGSSCRRAYTQHTCQDRACGAKGACALATVQRLPSFLKSWLGRCGGGDPLCFGLLCPRRRRSFSPGANSLFPFGEEVGRAKNERGWGIKSDAAGHGQKC